MPFPLWQRPDELADALEQLTADFPPCDRWGVTMTGELADCFATKAEGVAHILRHVRSAAGQVPVSVWQTGGEFLDPDEAVEWPLLVAAANWHALATWVGRAVPHGPALLIDIGSTTTDIIPLVDGMPLPRGLTDLERLGTRELVYTGVRRTPLCAVTGQIAWYGGTLPLAAELFATTADVYTLLERIPEDPERTDTANGRPLTRVACHDRLVRMLCADRAEIDEQQTVEIALQLADKQRQQIADAIATVCQTLPEPPQTAVLSGEGRWLAAEALGHSGWGSELEVLDLGFLEQSDIAATACAFAVARLARERFLP